MNNTLFFQKSFEDYKTPNTPIPIQQNVFELHFIEKKIIFLIRPFKKWGDEYRITKNMKNIFG